MLLYLPVTDGMWKQHELWDGTYTFTDWLDAIELIAVRRTNEERIRNSIEEQRG